MEKINRGQFLREIYENYIHGGVTHYAGFSEFGDRGYDYSKNGHSGPEILSNSTGGLFTYRVNTSGFIGNDFIQNPDILALGCSVTAGVGVKTCYSWPQLLSQKTGMSVNQFGMPGASISLLFSLFLESIAQYGKPKYVLLLAPELTRHWMYDTSHTRRARYYYDEESGFFRCFDKDQTIKMDMDSSSVDFRTIAGNSFSALTNLSIVCKLLGIEYRFFSWQNEDNKIFEEYDFSGYAHNIPQYLRDWHSNHLKPNQENRPYWYLGMDKSHCGVAEHYVYRDRFMMAMGLLKKDNPHSTQ